MDHPNFLTIEQVLYLHEQSIVRFGGSAGIRDRGQVKSALAAAVNAYYYRSADLYAIAATYAFHIAECQAFLDGNKRTAVATALAFLAENTGIMLVDDGRLYSAMISIANKNMDNEGLAELFRIMCSEQS